MMRPFIQVVVMRVTTGRDVEEQRMHGFCLAAPFVHDIKPGGFICVMTVRDGKGKGREEVKTQEEGEITRVSWFEGHYYFYHIPSLFHNGIPEAIRPCTAKDDAVLMEVREPLSTVLINATATVMPMRPPSYSRCVVLSKALRVVSEHFKVLQTPLLKKPVESVSKYC